MSENQRGEVLLTERAHQLSAGGGKPGQGYPAVLAFHATQDPISSEAVFPALGVSAALGVRRLTPRECERLQGFPDDWTRWDADGNELPDSARYRMMGNAVAVPVAEWVARRIMEAHR